MKTPTTPTLAEATTTLTEAHSLGQTVTYYDGSICDSDPTFTPTIGVDAKDRVSIDIEDDSDDGYTNHIIGTVKGLYASLTADETVTA